jgi:alpha-beta hydrolase superfamily lysophospholipase
MLTSPAATMLPFTASDGENLALHDWPLPRQPRRGTVLLVRPGRHAARYGHVARHLNAWGFAVRAGQYGHGRSAGPRGG